MAFQHKEVLNIEKAHEVLKVNVILTHVPIAIAQPPEFQVSLQVTFEMLSTRNGPRPSTNLGPEFWS